MRQILKKLFENMTFFAVNAIGITIPLAIVTAANIIAAVFNKWVPYVIVPVATFVLMGVFNVITYISYKKHEKNVMKATLSSILTLLIINILLNVQLRLANGGLSVLSIVIYGILLAAFLGLFVNHLIINSDHNPSPVNVYINQIIVLVILLVDIVPTVISYITAKNFNILSMLITIANLLVVVMQCATIVCVESKLDAYRIMRKDAGWTEEKGYPENYDRTRNYGK